MRLSLQASLIAMWVAVALLVSGGFPAGAAVVTAADGQSSFVASSGDSTGAASAGNGQAQLSAQLPADQVAPALRVVTTLPMIGEWASAVGGGRVTVLVLAQAGSDPHSFEPTARSIASASSADVVFGLGLGLEPWLERITQGHRSMNLVWVAPHTGLRRLDASAGHDHSCTTGAHAHCEWDPHVWLDPLMAAQMVQTIAGELSAIAPADAELFAGNAAAYCTKLAELDADISRQLEPVAAADRKLVTNHDNLHYFARRYGFSVADTLFTTQGSEGGHPSARKVRALVRRIHEQGIRALFADGFNGQDLLQAVAKEAGLPPPVVLYSIPGASGGPAADYFSMMRHNARAIAEALGPQQ